MGKTLLALMAAGALALGVSSCGNRGELMGIRDDDYPKITSNPTLTVNEGQTYNYQIEGTNLEKYSLVPTEDKNDDWLSVSPTGLVSGTAPRIKHEITLPITARGSKGSENFTQEFNLTIKEVIDYAVSPGQSIQNAINSAPEGSKIGVRSGTYNQNLNINKRIFLVGIDGEVYLTPAIDLPVVTISASGNSHEEPLFLRNFNIYTASTGSDPGKKTGVWIASASPLAHIGLEDIIITGNNISYVKSGLESGVSISQNVSVDDLEIEDSHFKDLSYGFISGAITSANPGYLTNLKMKNTILEHNSTKGFYVERLSDALLENVTLKDNGNLLLSPSWADPWNSGMDINLKYGNYKNITIKNLNATGNGIGHTQGTGLTIKARGTGSDSAAYSSVPAHLEKVYVLGGVFSGNNSDIRFGEIGKGNTSPTEIIVRGVQYTTLINALSGVTIQN